MALAQVDDGAQVGEGTEASGAGDGGLDIGVDGVWPAWSGRRKSNDWPGCWSPCCLALPACLPCLPCLLLLGGAVVLIVNWGTPYRAAAVLALVLVYGLGALFAWARFRALAQQSHLAFAAAREELAADIAMIRSRL